MSKLRNRALRMLQTQNNDDYVKDGLVLWLDGYSELNRIPNASTYACYWDDLSGFNDCAEVVNTSKAEGAVIFDGSTSFGLINADQPISVMNILTGLKDRTVEIVFKLNDTENSQVVFLGSNNGTNTIDEQAAGIWYRPASGGLKVGSLTSQYCSVVSAESLKERASYSVVYSETGINDYILYQNGTECPKGDAAGNMHNVYYPMIGSRCNTSGVYGYHLNGDVSCIRVYDRKLTDKEREHNLMIDRRRFNI